MSLLQVTNLKVHYPGAERAVVDDLSFDVDAGESVGLIGESGSGKSQTALACMGLTPAHAQCSGSIKIEDEELLGATSKKLNAVRATRMAMIFQDPGASLNPYLTIGKQLGYVLSEHGLARPGADVTGQVIDMLKIVGLPDPDRQFRAYPHELSGGMRQRAMIGAALLGKPDLLIADEPTTALDVTVQAQILALLRDLRKQTGAALLLITHDLGVVAGHCDRVIAIEQGREVERGGLPAVFDAPSSQSIRNMLAATPRRRQASRRTPIVDDAHTTPVLDVKDLELSFKERSLPGSRKINAVKSLSLSLRRGETLAVVGESGSGKTSLARALMGLVVPTKGDIRLQGKPLAADVARRDRPQTAALQMVFQDPHASLNPAMRINDIVAEPLQVHKKVTDPSERRNAVVTMFARVGLGEELLRRFPHELSGGQAQRVAIARALILEPAVLVCDEAVAALDAGVRQDIVDVLMTEQQRSGMAIIFITHDLALVRAMSHRVLSCISAACSSFPTALRCLQDHGIRIQGRCLMRCLSWTRNTFQKLMH